MMQRIFFHSPYDKNSKAILASLPQDVQVITMFQRDTVLPFEVRAVPLLVDKQLVLLTQPPYYTGGFVLQFQLQDWEGNPISENHLFYIDINRERYSEQIENDLLELQLIADVETAITVEINSEGFMPWKGEIAIENNPNPA